MPTKDEALFAFRSFGDYEAAAEQLGVPPGQAYLVATGLPADGGDTHGPEELRRPGALEKSTQFLVYHHPQPEHPTKKPHVHDWIRSRLEADHQMRAAAQRRHAGPGEILEPEETDICTVLTRDHDQVTALLKQLKTIPGASNGGSPVHLSRRKSIVDMVTVALSQHEASEQEHFWPAVRSLFAEGDRIADGALSQEQEGKDLLHRLGKLGAGDEEFDDLAEELDAAARRHVAYEDAVLLQMRHAIPLDERRRLGAKVRSTERSTPTRPHPHAPKKPVGAVKVAGAAAAAMDTVRDEVGDRPAERRGKGASEVSGGEQELE